MLAVTGICVQREHRAYGKVLTLLKRLCQGQAGQPPKTLLDLTDNALGLRFVFDANIFALVVDFIEIGDFKEFPSGPEGDSNIVHQLIKLYLMAEKLEAPKLCEMAIWKAIY